MCTHALIALPTQRRFAENGEQIRIQGFVRNDGIDESTIARFEKDHKTKVLRADPWIEINRIVTVGSYDGMRAQAAKLGADIKECFKPTVLTFH